MRKGALHGAAGDVPCKVVVLPVGKERRIPVEVEGLKVLHDVGKGDPKGAGHVLVWACGGGVRVSSGDAGPRQGRRGRWVGLCVDCRGRAQAFPHEPVAPRVLEQHALLARLGELEVHHGIVVLASETEGVFLLPRQTACAERHHNVAIVVRGFDALPCLV